jgi:hypothetical protein
VTDRAAIAVLGLIVGLIVAATIAYGVLRLY